MYKKLLCLVLILVGWSASNANAFVIIGDRQWLQPADLVGYSWNDFSAVCSAGSCSGSLGAGVGPDVSGWQWASIDQVGDLFAAISEYPGGRTEYYSSDVSVAFEVFRNAGFRVSTNFDLAVNFGISAVVGYSSTRAPATNSAYLGFVQAGLFPGFSRGTTIDTTSTFEIDERSDVIGGWLYRVNTVPTVSTVWLLFAGLSVLFARARTGRISRLSNARMRRARA